ncbi:MAG: hypothetical protein AAF530_10150 [Pseudomonadota bacterium]
MTNRKFETSSIDLLVQARDRRNAFWAALARKIFQAPEQVVAKVHREPRNAKVGHRAFYPTQPVVDPLLAKGYHIS